MGKTWQDTGHTHRPHSASAPMAVPNRCRAFTTALTFSLHGRGKGVTK